MSPQASRPSDQISDRSPARFLVGQDAEGHWLALEEHGRAGGIFRSEDAARHYAVFETDHRPGAVAKAHKRLTLRL